MLSGNLIAILLLLALSITCIPCSSIPRTSDFADLRRTSLLSNRTCAGLTAEEQDPEEPVAPKGGSSRICTHCGSIFIWPVLSVPAGVLPRATCWSRRYCLGLWCCHCHHCAPLTLSAGYIDTVLSGMYMRSSVARRSSSRNPDAAPLPQEGTL
jgi:hypothetical protein